MTNQTKNNMKGWVGTWLTPSLIIGAVVAGAWYTGQLKVEAETKMFEDPAQKQKTKQHIDSDYNEVKNYQLMQEVTKMKVELDTSYAFVNALFREDRAARIADSANSANAKASRIKRDSLVEAQAQEIKETKQNLTRIENAIQVILMNQNKILDTIN